MKGSVDRIENTKAIIILDNKEELIVENIYGLKESDRIIYKRKNKTIKKIDNTDMKKEMIDLQNDIFGKG